jgi:Fe2+ transport system protein FeoA
MRASPHIALVDLVAGSRARVVSVPDRDADRLAAEGLQPGGELELEALLPLGGPIVVRIGRARVALARQVAAAIAVEPRSPRAPDRPRP